MNEAILSIKDSIDSTQQKVKDWVADDEIVVSKKVIILAFIVAFLVGFAVGVMMGPAPTVIVQSDKKPSVISGLKRLFKRV